MGTMREVLVVLQRSECPANRHQSSDIALQQNASTLHPNPTAHKASRISDASSQITKVSSQLCFHAILVPLVEGWQPGKELACL